MGNINPKTITMLASATGGLAIGAGALQALGIDAGAVAEDVATLVVNGLAGCPAEPADPVCAAGHRVTTVLALAGVAALCGWLGRLLGPKPATAEPLQPGAAIHAPSGTATLGTSDMPPAAPAIRG